MFYRIGLLTILLSISVGCSSKNVATIPIKYFLIEQNAVFNNNSSVILNAHYRMKFSESKSKDQYFALPFGREAKFQYLSIVASVIKSDLTKIPLEIKLEKKTLKDLLDIKYEIVEPHVLLPAINSNDVVEIQFDVNIGESNVYMYLPEEVVDAATFTVREKGMPIQTEANGFKMSAVTDLDGWNSQTFEMLPESRSAATRSGMGHPAVLASSQKNWNDIAEEVNVSYKRELRKNLDLSEALKVIPAELANAAPSLDRSARISFLLYTWLVDNFKYKSVFLDPRYGIEARPLERIWDNKVGDCKDFSVLYIKLLSSFDIISEPVFVPGYSNTFLPRRSSIASLDIFSHVVVYIPEMNAYVDLTSGQGTNFNTSKGRYADTFGLHLFSKKYQKITIKSSNFKRSMTTLRQDKGEWLGVTSWEGSGNKREDIVKSAKTLDDIMMGRKKAKVLEKNGLTLKLGSWTVSENALNEKMSAKFDYVLKNSPIDPSGRLVSIPYNFTAGALLEFDSAVDLSWSMRNPCTAKSISQEIIEIHGVTQVAALDAFRSVKIIGISREFIQTINLVGDKLSIVRTLTVFEDRLICPENDLAGHMDFFQRINILKEKTRKHLIFEKNDDKNSNGLGKITQ